MAVRKGDGDLRARGLIAPVPSEAALLGASYFDWFLRLAEQFDAAEVPSQIWYSMFQGEAARCCPQVERSGKMLGGERLLQSSVKLAGVTSAVTLPTSMEGKKKDAAVEKLTHNFEWAVDVAQATHPPSLALPTLNIGVVNGCCKAA